MVEVTSSNLVVPTNPADHVATDRVNCLYRVPHRKPDSENTILCQ
jgi:hypothetical protein